MNKMMMIALCVAAAACGKASGNGIDKASFHAMTDGIHADDAWAAASGRADKLLGPAKVKKDDEWDWAVADDSDCWELVLYKNGDKVGGVSSTHARSEVAQSYAKCVAVAKPAS